MRTSWNAGSSRNAPNVFGSGVRQLFSRQSSWSYSSVAGRFGARVRTPRGRPLPSSVKLKETARWKPQCSIPELAAEAVVARCMRCDHTRLCGPNFGAASRAQAADCRRPHSRRARRREAARNAAARPGASTQSASSSRPSPSASPSHSPRGRGAFGRALRRLGRLETRGSRTDGSSFAGAFTRRDTSKISSLSAARAQGAARASDPASPDPATSHWRRAQDDRHPVVRQATSRFGRVVRIANEAQRSSFSAAATCRRRPRERERPATSAGTRRARARGPSATRRSRRRTGARLPERLADVGFSRRGLLRAR